jgi:WD40 repeat protein
MRKLTLTGLIVASAIAVALFVTNTTRKERLSLHLTLRSDNQSITSIAFRSDGSQIVSGNMGGTIQVWDVGTGLRIQDFSSITPPILAVEFTDEDRTIIALHGNGSLSAWDLATKEQLNSTAGPEWSLQRKLGGTVAAAFGRNSDLLALEQDLGRVAIWEISNQNVDVCRLSDQDGIPQYVHCLALSPDGSKLASASSQERIYIHDLKGAKLVRNIDWVSGSLGKLLAFTESGETLFVGDGRLERGSIRLYDLRLPKPRLIYSRQLAARVTAVAISRNGDFLFAVTSGHELVFGTPSKRMFSEVNATSCEMVTMAIIDPTDRYVATGGNDGTVAVWRRGGSGH